MTGVENNVSLFVEEMFAKMMVYLRKNAKDFPEVEELYHSGVNALIKCEGDTLPFVFQIRDVMDEMAIAEFVQGFHAGVKANYKYFMDPAEGDFLARYDAVEREILMEIAPAYRQREQSLHLFCADLPKEHMEELDAVIGYRSYLETYGIKLAHYMGYLFGNRQLHTVYETYQPNGEYTQRYHDWLEEYTGMQLPVVLEQF